MKSLLHWTCLVEMSNSIRGFGECLENSTTSDRECRITSRTASELNRNILGFKVVADGSEHSPRRRSESSLEDFHHKLSQKWL